MTNLKNILYQGVNFLLIIPLLMVIATVFRVDNTLANPTVSAKYEWFGYAVALAGIASLIVFLFNRRKVKLSIVDLLITVFCFWGIALTYYLDNTFTLKLNILLLLWSLYVICRISIAQNKSYSSILLFGIILTGLVEAVWGLGQLYGHYSSQHSLFKTTGSFYNPGPYAGYLSLILPIAFYYLLFDYHIIKGKLSLSGFPLYFRWVVSLLTFILIISILPATMSRASWLASALGCFFIIITYVVEKYKESISYYYQQNRKQLLIGIGAAIIIISCILFGMYYLKKDSADGRALMWKISLATIQENPMGVGVGYFSNAYGDAQSNYFATEESTEQEQLVSGAPEYAFNEYLQIGIEFGVVPLLLFVITTGFTIYIGCKRKNYAPMAALLAFLLFSTMSYPFSLLPFLIIFITLIALCISDNENQKCDKKRILIYSFLILSALAIIAVTLHKYQSLEDSYRAWNRIKMLNNVGIDEKQAKAYEENLVTLRHESPFLFEYAQCLNRLKRYEDSNRILEIMKKVSCDPMLYNVMGRNYQSLGKYHEAEESFIKACQLIPSRLYPYYLLTKLYDEMGEKEKAIRMAQIVQTKEAKVHSPAIDEMREELKEIYKKYE